MKNILWIALVTLTQNMFAQEIITIGGRVTDNNNHPLPYANVFLLNTTDGSMTDDNGYFSFTTSLSGSAKLTASMVGYKKFAMDIDLISDVNINVILEAAAVKLNEAIITASSYGSEKEKGLVVSRMDILTTPGGATDIYQSLKTMPGMTQVSESAELYVRGGDPIESITMINQSIIYHPFTFESAYGGIFSNIDQSSIKSIYFTSGGFSAKYGNALSGVLDIEVKNQPEKTRPSPGLSLASGNITTEISIDPDKFGLYFDARQTFTAPIFWLNGGSDRMTTAPTSRNISGGAVYNYSKTGKLKFFNMYSDDEQGVKVERAEYTGAFTGNTKNLFINIQQSDLPFENLVVKNSFGYNRYSNHWLFGILDLVKTDHVYSFRSDAEFMPGSGFKILSGIDIENRSIKYLGKIPEEDYNIRPGAISTIIDAELKGLRYGIYAELQSANLLGIQNLSATAGIRYDKFIKLHLDWFDPRFGLGYKLNDNTILRFGFGIFRQIPDPRLFNPVDGNPSLEPMKAVHFIGSYEYKFNDHNSFRAEIYRKNYSSLPLENILVNYDNSGCGFANGIDLIYKGTLPPGIEGWISYGYINTKRLWMDFDSYTSSSFNITHNLAIVAKYNLNEKFQIGITAKYATGRPFTPVFSGHFREDINVYEPVYGLTNSARFPDYKRADLRLTYFDKLFDSYSLIAFIEAINVLNFENIFGYSYTEDYTERKNIKSYFGRRMIVTGFTVGL